MTRRKRPYMPKIKGCHECSQRRIHCDRTQPSCRKCMGKGITCSGFGTSWTFRNSFLSGTKGPKKTRRSYEEQALAPGVCSIWTRESCSNCEERGTHASELPEIPSDDRSLTCYLRALSPVSSGDMFLLDYFSQFIAPEMVIIDDQNNGWRNMALPIAHRNDLVMKAVITASAFHLSSRRDSGFQEPTKLYAKAIAELQKKRKIDEYDIETQHFIILAILVLLVALMINGSSDFPILFHMLQSALAAIGGDLALTEGDLAQFILRQIHKVRVYGAPFISQDVGTCTLIFEGQQSFDCLRYYSNLYPDYLDSFERILSMRQQAYDIYLYRASLGDEAPPFTSMNLVESFRASLEQIPEGSLGENSLIWACFIAASESNSPEHQSFFESYLKRQFIRNGFVNILRALDLLQQIRKKQAHKNWTKLLPEPQVIIM